MRKGQHTPGPWEDSSLPGVKIFAGNMTICDVRGWGYLTGAGGLRLPDEEAIAIQCANARLIAAAPDLLAAAQLAVLNFKRSQASGNFQGDDEHESWSALNAAIAKATALSDATTVEAGLRARSEK